MHYNLFWIIQVTNTHYKGYILLAVSLKVSQNYNKYFLAIYDTAVSPYTYTGSEDIDTYHR